MGNVNEATSERTQSGVAELPGALRNGQEGSENSDNDSVPISSSSFAQVARASDSADISRLSSPVFQVHDADSSSMWIAAADSSGIQSSPDGMFDTSTQSSNTSFPISESALPTTFDVSPEITFSNPSELSDYFTSSLTHPGVDDQVFLSDTPFTSVVARTEQSLRPLHNRLSRVPPISLTKGTLGLDCASGISLASSEDDAKPELSTHEARHPVEIDAGVLHPSDIALGVNTATVATSSAHRLALVSSHRNVMVIQPSVRIPEAIDSAFSSTGINTHVSQQHPKENSVLIDNSASGITDAVATKSTSELHTDKEAILADIPLAATYADAANLAVQYPELAKELLSRPLLAPSQSRGPLVPRISYATADWTAPDARSRDDRRAPRRGDRNDRSYSQSLSRPPRCSEGPLEPRYMQYEITGNRHEISLDSRRGRPDSLPYLDWKSWPSKSNRHQGNTGDSSRTRRQDSSQINGQTVSCERRSNCADASRGLLDGDSWRLFHDPCSAQDKSLSRVPSHETRYTTPLDRSNAGGCTPSHDLGAQRGSDSQGQAVHQAVPDQNMDVGGPHITDDWTHSHDPWVPRPQAGSQVQAVHQVASDKNQYIDGSTQSNADEWRPAHGSWASEAIPTESDGLPGWHSRVSYNVASNACASDVMNDQRQVHHDQLHHDPLATGQSVISGAGTKQYHQPPPSFMQHKHPTHIRSQLTASILSRPDRIRGDNFGSGTTSPDSHHIARRQQVVGNKPESEKRLSSAETGNAGQAGLGDTSSEECRSVSSSPQIVAHLDIKSVDSDEERPYKTSGRHSTEWHRARPPTPAMISTRPLECEETQLNTPVVKFRSTGDPLVREIYPPYSNVDLSSERKSRISRNLAPGSNLRPSHAASQENQEIRRSAHQWLKLDVARDTILQHVNPLRNNANDDLPSLPSISQNDLASHVLQYSTSSNPLHTLNLRPRAETAVHLQLGFDPRAGGWLANPNQRGRGRVANESFYPSTNAHPRHSLPARPVVSSSKHTYEARDIRREVYGPEFVDSRKIQLQDEGPKRL